MARLALVLVLTAPSTALGDEEADPGWTVPSALLPSQLQAIGAGETTTVTRHDGPTGWMLELESRTWSNRDDPDPLRPTIDLPGRGASATARVFVDLGPVDVAVTGQVAEIDSVLGRGRYVDVGVAITRTLRLSRWMTAWISLGAGVRRWLGAAPEGESDAGQVTLTIGATFE